MSEIVIKEKILSGYPNVISYECTKKIIEQMEKNIFKIKIGDEQGTGFFCKIPYNNKIVLMTNNHVIDENINEINIKIKEEKESRIINLNNRIKYTNKEYDITIIEMNEKDNINNYLELDDNIELNEEYIDKTIYIIQYPEGELSVSYGILDNIYIDKKYNFNHKCSTKGGSSGSPILNIKNNKLIGIHKESSNGKFNRGLFLNYPIQEYIKLYNNKLQEFNEKYDLITMTCDVVNHILKEDSLKKVFDNIYNMLNDDGYLIFDIINPSELVLNEEIVSNRGNNINVYYYITNQNDLINTNVKIEQDNTLVFEYDVLEKLYDDDLIKTMLKECHFKLVKFAPSILNEKYKPFNIYRILDEITAAIKAIKNKLIEKGFNIEPLVMNNNL